MLWGGGSGVEGYGEFTEFRSLRAMRIIVDYYQ